MNVRQYLDKAYYLDLRVERELKELAELKRLTTGLRTAGLEENNNPNHPTVSPFVKALERIWSYEERINEEIDRLFTMKEQIREWINGVEDEEIRTILYYRYVSFADIEELEQMTHRKRRWIFYKLQQGIEEIQKKVSDLQ